MNGVMARIGGREVDNKKKVQILHDVFVQGKYLSYMSITFRNKAVSMVVTLRFGLRLVSWPDI